MFDEYGHRLNFLLDREGVQCEQMKFYATPEDEVTIIPLNAADGEAFLYELPKKCVRTGDTTIFFCDEVDDDGEGEGDSDGDATMSNDDAAASPFSSPFCVRMYAASNRGVAMNLSPKDFLPGGKALRMDMYSDVATLIDLHLRIEKKREAVSHVIDVAEGINDIFGIAYMQLPDGNCIIGTVEPRRWKSLDKLLKSLSREDALDILLQISKALDRLHALGVVHNDLKPANILVDRDETEGSGRRYTVYLGDLDLSMPVGASAECVGSVGYMSPDMFDIRAITRASDTWAFANIIHEVIYARDLFRFSDVEAIEDPTEYLIFFGGVIEELEEYFAQYKSMTEKERKRKGNDPLGSISWSPFDYEVRRAIYRILTERPDSATGIIEELANAHEKIKATRVTKTA